LERREPEQPRNRQVGPTTSTSVSGSTCGPDEPTEEDPDVIPGNKAERRLDTLEPKYVPKPERMKELQRQLQSADLSYRLALASSQQQQQQQHSAAGGQNTGGKPDEAEHFAGAPDPRHLHEEPQGAGELYIIRVTES
jgi:hypothetical protein